MNDMGNEKYLEPVDLLKLELSQKEQMIRKLEKMLLEKDSNLLKHQQEQLKLKIALLDFESYKKQIAIVNKQKQIDKNMEEARNFHSELEAKYDLEPGWGYDPETLKLIQKED